MLVELEQCRIEKKVTTAQEERIKLLEEISAAKDEIIRLQNEQKAIQAQTIEGMKGIINTQKDAYEGIIKSSKPSFWEDLGKILGSIAVGIGIGLAIL